MATFLKCSAASITYRETELLNHPINISLCISIQKSRCAWYPDNNGIPTLVFRFSESPDSKSDIIWYYKDKATRQIDYDKLIAS